MNRNRSQWVAEAVVRDGEGREVGRGSGLFVRSAARLADALGYGGGPIGDGPSPDG